MRARLALACALLAATLTAPTHGIAAADVPAATDATSERELRELESDVLGPEHAAEHARARRAAADPRVRVAARRAAAGRAVGVPAANPAEDGRWGAPFDIPVMGIHAVMLPTGKVMWFAYPQNANGQYGNPDAPNTATAWLWDPETGRSERVDPPLWRDPADGQLKPANIWCASQGLTADGRVVVVGGNMAYPPKKGETFKGLDKVYTFNPWNETWTEQPDMEHGRWYPSQVLLPDGDIAIMGGLDDTGGPTYTPNLQIEVFTPSDDLDGLGALTYLGDRTMTGAPGLPPDGGLYPHLFWMPSERVLVAGPDPNDSWFLHDPTTGFGWDDFDPASVRRLWGSAVLLPDGPDGSTQIELLGGSSRDATKEPPDSLPTPTTEVYDEVTNAWTSAAPLQIARSHLNTVLLPDASMVTVGGGLGAIGTNSWAFDGEQRQVELYDPVSGEWRLGAAQVEGRAYHSTALLLPDGRVVSAGDDLNGGIDRDTAEVYEPPYLFDDDDGGYAERPRIEAAPATVRYVDEFHVETSGPAVTAATLVAPGAVTHANDMNQRVVPLELTPAEGGVTLTAPASGNVAPPGWYMLFVLDAQGVPSVSRWVLVGQDPPPLGTVEIELRTDPPSSEASFSFPGAPFGGAALRHGESQSVALPGGPSAEEPGGHYSVKQAVTPGYELASVGCDDADSQAEVSNGRALVHLAAGESVRCTFTNRRLPDPPAAPEPDPDPPADEGEKGPSISFNRRKGLRRGRRALAGRASDPDGVRRVKVALGRPPKKGPCRWWSTKRGRLAKAKRSSCRRPAWTRAKLSGRATNVKWTVRLGARLPAGRYRLMIRAYDGTGQVSRWPSRGGTAALRVPRRKK